MSRSDLLLWSTRALVATVVVIASILAGGELRASRDDAAAARRASASPPAVGSVTKVTPTPTPIPTTTPSYSATATPVASATPASSPAPSTAGTWISGRVTVPRFGSVKNVQIRIYRADGFANGPTPVPPAVAETIAGLDGTYKASLPAGTYKVGAFIAEPISQTLGCWWVTWYGDAYAIGLSRTVSVSGGTPNVDITMLSAFTISGEVVGRDGVGLPHAAVRTEYSGNVAYPMVSATTDASGRFSFRTVPMNVTLRVETAGKSGIVGTSAPLDVRGDMSGLRYTVDRGNILAGTLRDSSGHVLGDTSFAAVMADPSVQCGGSCSARTDNAGTFALVVPDGVLHFRTWPATTADPTLVSPDYTIRADTTLDPVLTKP